VNPAAAPTPARGDNRAPRPPDAPVVLLVAKHATIDRLAPADVERLLGAGVNTRQRLEEARQDHESCLDAVRRTLAQRGCGLRERRLGDLRDDDADGCHLVICVGGDGTVFAVHRQLGSVSVLAINSDPRRSIGHFTRALRDDLDNCLDAWRDGAAPLQNLPRLAVHRHGRPLVPILNDALFTSTNPAAMSRYRIDDGRICELHWSSGVWVATAAGATGAIASAGLYSQPCHGAALLFRVREPYQPKHPYQLIDGRQAPPGNLTLCAGMPGIALYLDGQHACLHLDPGEELRIDGQAPDLHLLLPPT
jgi:NAD+ kinase